MSMILWVLLGSLLGLTASKVVSTTGEGTVVDIMLGTGGAVMAGWMFAALGGGGATGFNIGTVEVDPVSGTTGAGLLIGSAAAPTS